MPWQSSIQRKRSITNLRSSDYNRLLLHSNCLFVKIVFEIESIVTMLRSILGFELVISERGRKSSAAKRKIPIASNIRIFAFCSQSNGHIRWSVLEEQIGCHYALRCSDEIDAFLVRHSTRSIDPLLSISPHSNIGFSFIRTIDHLIGRFSVV